MAAAQVGQHNEKRESFARIIIDPWGRILGSSGCIDREARGRAI